MKLKSLQNLKLKGHYKFTIRDAVTNEIKRVIEVDNLIPTAARAMFVDLLTNPSSTFVPLIKYAGLGSSTSAPANSDTQLGTEVYRNAIASYDNDNNIAYATAYFNAVEVTGTFKEAGIFCGGSASANTGVLFSHVSVNITKSGSETLTIDWTLTLN